MSLVNEPSSLGSVSSEIARANGNITNFKILHRYTDFFDIRFHIEVMSSSHLEQIINALKMVKAVQQVRKVKY